MALNVSLGENGNPGTGGRDRITIKCENISYPITRTPLVYVLPAGQILSLDLGRIRQDITLTVVLDQEVTELFVDNKAGGDFLIGDIITGNAAWDASVTPVRTVTPTATIVGALPSLAAPTTLFISGLSYGNDDFFVDNELITAGGAPGRTALVNQPLGSHHRWEQVFQNFYSTGTQTLYTPNGNYTVQMVNLQMERQAGIPNIYIGKMTFVKVA